MSQSAQAVADHYKKRALGDVILAALRAAGKDIEHLTPDDRLFKDLTAEESKVVEQFRGGYPELEDHRADIQRILTAEEERFSRTLERGMRLFEEIAQKGGDISGSDAFRLHDTYGFPLELTQELARERGLGVNEEEFTRLMAEQRERSRAAISKDDRRAAEFGRRAGFKTDFVGYEKLDVLTQIGALEELGDGLFLA